MVTTLGIALFASLSPQLIVYAGGANDHNRIYLMNFDGTSRRTLTEGYNDYNPIFSTDKSTIFFTRMTPKPNGNSIGHLFQMKPNGTGLKQLTFGDVFDSACDQQLKSSRVLFDRQQPSWDTRELDLKTGSIRIRPGYESWAILSPNRLHQLVPRPIGPGEDEHASDLWVSTTTFKNLRRITNMRSELDAHCWMPDSNSVLMFFRDHSNGKANRLIQISTHDKKITTFAQIPYMTIFDMKWSPDGQRLAVTMSQDVPTGSHTLNQLYVFSANGKKRQRLTNHWGNDYIYAWSQDSQTILIQTSRGLTDNGNFISGTAVELFALVNAYGKGEKLLSFGPWE